MKKLFLLALVAFVGCKKCPERVPPFTKVLDHYRLRVPSSWTQVDETTFAFGECTFKIYAGTTPLTSVKEENLDVEAVGWSGFTGFRFEREGFVAFRLALDPEHLQTLRFLEKDLTPSQTIILKAKGPSDQIEAARTEINACAHSFELTEPLPSLL